LASVAWIYTGGLNVGNWEKSEVQLYMRVEGNDTATIELAKQIFKTVTLPAAAAGASCCEVVFDRIYKISG
jgi:hypothetical protein